MKKSPFTSVLLVLAFVLAACGATAPAVERPPLKIAWSLWPGWYPIAIAQEKGFFAKQGVNIEPVLYTTYTDIMPDFASGQIDGALLASADAILLEAQQPGFSRAILITDYSDGQDVIMATADVQTMADLKGKTLGALKDTFGEVLLLQMLKQNGVKRDEVTIVNIEPEKVPDSLGTLIAAGHTFGPDITRAEKKGGHILFTSASVPGLIADLLSVRNSVAEQRPEDLRAFNAAWFEALAWWQANEVEGNAIIAKAAGLKPEEISYEGVKLFNLTDNQKAFRPGTELTSIHANAKLYTDFFGQAGIITKNPDFDKFIDPSFLP